MPKVVWFFDRLFLPRRLDFGEVAVVPLSVRGDALGAAVAAYGALEGSTLGYLSGPIAGIDMAAVVFRGVEAAVPDDAMATTVGQARAIASALGVRQMGRGRLLGAIVQTNGRIEIRRSPVADEPVINLPFVPEEQEVAEILRAFTEHPQAVVFADLFAEACRDKNPSAGVARLWGVLEALADRLPGSNFDKVATALELLGVTEPTFDGKGLLRRAYDVRNDFMHHGRLAPPELARRLQDELASLVWFTLRHANMAPVMPEPTRLHKIAQLTAQ